MAPDYWESTEMNEANLSMGELWNRTFSPMVCDNCRGLHRTMACPHSREARYCEDEANLSMQELYTRHLSFQEACKLCGGVHDTQKCSLGYQQHLSWSENRSYHNWHDPHVYQEDFFGLPTPSPDIHNQFEADEECISREEFEELKESMMRIEATLGQLLKLSGSKPQEDMLSQGEECSNELMSNKHGKGEVESKNIETSMPIERQDEEEEFVEEINEEESLVEDLEVMACVNPILAFGESNPDVMMNKEPLIELYEQEEKFIKVDFVVEFLPEQYLKIKRQRDIEFILRIKDKDRKNKRSRKEEATPRGSRPYKGGRTLQECIVYTIAKGPGTAKEHGPDTMPFDPGG